MKRTMDRSRHFELSTMGRVILVAGSMILLTISLAYPRNTRHANKSLANPLNHQQRTGRAIGSSGDRKLARVSEMGMRQIGALLAEKESRTLAQRKIDSQLLQSLRESRGEAMAAGVNLRPANIKVDDKGVIAVDITASVNDDLLKRIRDLGGIIIYPSVQYHTIRALVSLSSVETLATFQEISFIQPAVQAFTSRATGDATRMRPEVVGTAQSALSARHLGGNSLITGLRPPPGKRAETVRNRLAEYISHLVSPAMFEGSVTSEGDRTHRADDARNIALRAGEGVRIGVLSDSLNSNGLLGNTISGGDLPGPGNPLGNVTPVTIVQDLPGIIFGQVEIVFTDEGNPMLQIVHDIAPKAQLFFATADISEANFATNILALRKPPYNCDIIIDDVEYLDEPAFQDGIVAQAVNAVTADGALYFSSAGNEGSLAKKTSGVWEGDFSDTGSTLTIPGTAKSGTILNFGTPSSPVEGDQITSPGFVDILSWSDPMGGSDNDYDLFIMDPTLTNVLFASTNIQDGEGNPIEAVPDFGAGNMLVVFKSSGAATRAIRLSAFRGTLSIATNGQIFGHTAAEQAFSVAATPAAASFDSSSPTGPFPNPFSSSNVAENYSSDGPRRIFYKADGTAITPGNVLFGTAGGLVRNKPDITAADGVSFASDCCVFLQPPFFGTSAAAPHAGAIAALLKSANPSLTPGQIRNILTSTALDIESPGFDDVSGFGIIQALQAMQSVLPSAQPTLGLGQVAATEGSFSNHNGKIEPGETVNIVVSLTNQSQEPIKNAKAVLSSPSSGVSMLKGAASFGDIAPGTSNSNSGTPFTIGLHSFNDEAEVFPTAVVVCGSKITLSLKVSYDGASDPQEFSFTVDIDREQSPVISAVLGRTRPDGPDFATVSSSQFGALSQTGTPSSCSTPVQTPPLTDTILRVFDSYTFVNHGPDQCVTVTMDSPRGNFLYTVAYGDSFNFFGSGSITDNFLGAAGSSSTHQSFSFMAKAGQTIIIVVHESINGSGTGSPYSLSLSLEPLITLCESGPTCQISFNPALLPGATVGQPYNQTFGITGGSGFASASVLLLSSLFPQIEFPDLKTIVPGGLSFTNNVLSGTPTQAGEFDFNVQATDPICTGPLGIGTTFQLKVSGNLPASIAAISGDGQTVVVGQPAKVPLQAIVRDSNNNPLPGVAVLFESSPFNFPIPVTFNGPTRVITDANGMATAPPFAASNFSESYTIFGEVNGLAPAVFNLTNSCTNVVSNNADSGPGSLRDTIANACENSTITFDPRVAGTITLTSGEIVIKNKTLAIQGPGAAALTISGGNSSRIFSVVSDDGEHIEQLDISGLTLKNGAPSQSDTSGGGGALLIDRSIVQLTDTVITGNDVSNSLIKSGGGIEVGPASTLIVSKCAIVENSAASSGGGIHVASTATLSITQSTVAENSAGSTGRGGGLAIDFPSVIQIQNVTIFGNSANAGGNLSANNSGNSIITSTSFTVTNSIIAGGRLTGASPIGADVNNVLFSGPTGDFNLIQDTTTTALTNTPHNIAGADPLLFPLGNYGGPSPTLLPRPDSPAIMSGPPADFQGTLLGTDQRHSPQRFTGNLDLGAVQTAYQVETVQGSQQSAFTLKDFAAPLTARVTESGGQNAPSGIKVTFAAPSSGPSCLFGNSNTVTVMTDSNGLATTPILTANASSGGYTVMAGIGPSFPEARYSLANISPPSSITVIQGTPQSTAVRALFRTPMQVLVRDGNGDPFFGAAVTFTAPPNGPSGIFNGATSAVVNTNLDGIAAAPPFTANNIVGNYGVTASVTGFPPVASFILSNVLPGPAATISATSGTPQSAGLGLGFGVPLQATVTDAAGIPVNGAAVTFSVISNAGASGTFPGNEVSAVATTDVNGQANSPVITANQSLGSFTVNATVSGAATPGVFTLTNVSVVFGDLSGDGQVTVQDLVIMANIIAGNISPTPTQRAAGDVFDDHSGQITIQDLVTLANFLAGNIHSLPVVTGAVSNPDQGKPLADSSARVPNSVEAGLIPRLRRDWLIN